MRQGIIKDWLTPVLELSLGEGQFGCRPGRSIYPVLELPVPLVGPGPLNRLTGPLNKV